MTLALSLQRFLMAIVFDFIRGFVVGVNFPGDGFHCAIFLGILRICFITKEVYEELKDD